MIPNPPNTNTKLKTFRTFEFESEGSVNMISSPAKKDAIIDIMFIFEYLKLR